MGERERDRNRNGEKGRETVEIIGRDNLRRQMGKNEARDNGQTVNMMAGERRETERSRDGVRDLESGGVKKSDPGHYPCSISAGQADGRLSAHYTS